MAGKWTVLAILGFVSLSQAAHAASNKGSQVQAMQPGAKQLLGISNPANLAEIQKIAAGEADVQDELIGAVISVQSSAGQMSLEDKAKIRKALDAKKAATGTNKFKPGLLAAEYSANLGGAAAEATGFDTMIQIGEKIWQVIQEGKPVANITTQKVHVVPIEQQDWSKMENWKGPSTCKFALELKNMFGWTLISHSYTIVFNYGGSYEGKGQYLANVTVMPDANVPLFFNLESSVEIGDPVNMGTKADPMPGLPIRINWRAQQIPARFNDRPGTVAAFIKGDGSCVQLTQ